MKMTQEEKIKLGELVSDYRKKEIEKKQKEQEHRDYMNSDEYKYGSDKSYNLANEHSNAVLEWSSAGMRIAQFVNEIYDNQQ